MDEVTVLTESGVCLTLRHISLERAGLIAQLSLVRDPTLWSLSTSQCHRYLRLFLIMRLLLPISTGSHYYCRTYLSPLEGGWNCRRIMSRRTAEDSERCVLFLGFVCHSCNAGPRSGHLPACGLHALHSAICPTLATPFPVPLCCVTVLLVTLGTCMTHFTYTYNHLHFCSYYYLFYIFW